MSLINDSFVKLATGIKTSGDYPVFTISAGGTLSSVIDLKGMSLVALKFPADWTVSTFSVLGSLDGANFGELYDPYTGAAITLQATAGAFCRVYPADFVGIRYLQIQSAEAQVSTAHVQCVAAQIL